MRSCRPRRWYSTLLVFASLVFFSGHAGRANSLPEPQHRCPSPSGQAALARGASDEALHLFEREWQESDRQLKACQCQIGTLQAKLGKRFEAKSAFRECLTPPYDHLVEAEKAAYETFVTSHDPAPRYRRPWVWMLAGGSLAILIAASIGIGVGVHRSQETTIINFPLTSN